MTSFHKGKISGSFADGSGQDVQACPLGDAPSASVPQPVLEDRPDKCLDCVNPDCGIRPMCCGDMARELAAGFKCPMSKSFCYWTVADGKHAKMAAVTVASARAVGVKVDFHIWTDMPAIEGATVHPCGRFNKSRYMFKLHFLKNEVSKLDYDYFVFFDADNYFVRDPGDLSLLMDNSKVFVQMENDCFANGVKRLGWWGIPIKKYRDLLVEHGAKTDAYYNTNAGFWIVSKSAIDEFYDRTTKFFTAAHQKGYRQCTEEPPLALAGHVMQDPSTRTLGNTSWLWATDWRGHWSGRLPKDEAWQFEDFMNGDKNTVKPCIVHCMRSKDAMIREYHRLGKGTHAVSAASVAKVGVLAPT
jgi:hypothetical protein